MRHSTKDNYLYLTTTPVPRLIVSLAVPTIISMLVTSFYNMADTYFVGKINTQSTAAVGIVFSVMSIIQAVGFFFGHGSGNYISRKLGAQETGNAEKMAATGFFWALFMGIFLAVVGLIFLTPSVQYTSFRMFPLHFAWEKENKFIFIVFLLFNLCQMANSRPS